MATLTTAELETLANALVVAQNALAGYTQLANSDATAEHFETAEHASDAVRNALRLVWNHVK